MKARNVLLLFLAAVLVALPLALTASAQQREAGDNPSVPVVPAIRIDGGGARTGAVGTIQYDNDTPFNRFGTLGGTVGNRFNPSLTHSVATVSFALGGNFATSVVMTVWDVNAASAMVLARQAVTGATQSPATSARFMAPVATAITGHTGSFVAGIRNTSYTVTCPANTALGSTCDGVALTSGNGNPNAVHMVWTSGSFIPVVATIGTTGADIPNVNAIFRATGKNLPVELMQFEVD